MSFHGEIEKITITNADEKYMIESPAFDGKFQRLVSLDYQKRFSTYQEERDKLEESFFKQVHGILKNAKAKPTKADLKKMTKITTDSFTKSIKNVKKWTKEIEILPVEAIRFNVFMIASFLFTSIIKSS